MVAKLAAAAAAAMVLAAMSAAFAGGVVLRLVAVGGAVMSRWSVRLGDRQEAGET